MLHVSVHVVVHMQVVRFSLGQWRAGVVDTLALMEGMWHSGVHGHMCRPCIGGGVVKVWPIGRGVTSSGVWPIDYMGVWQALRHS